MGLTAEERLIEIITEEFMDLPCFFAWKLTVKSPHIFTLPQFIILS